MYKYYVIGNQELTPTTLLLTLKNNSLSKVISFQPGQYAAISFKNHGRPTPFRNFSICNSSTDQGLLQFSIRIKGRFTNALTGLAEGDEVKVRGPFGGFVFDAERDTDTVMIAGGIGIAPFVSMIRYATSTNLKNNINLIYSCRDQNDVPFADQIKELGKINSNIKSTFVISEGRTDKFAGNIVKNGRITPEIIDEAINDRYDNNTFFICGPSQFMNSMVEILQNKGVADDKIMTEAFSQGSNRQTGKIRSWPFNIYMLGAVGVAAASFVVMVGDLIKTLPPVSSFGSTNVANPSSLTNSRQDDLDELVNGLPIVSNNAPATNAVTNAAQQSSTSSSTSTTSSTPASIITPTPTAPTPAPTPVPAPRPAPVCTTTQSGVTTCV